jgi:HTH-type transcriptional regulator / antitoxin MqsA
MKCPVCGEAELVQDTRDVLYTYKDESAIVPAVTGDFCPSCGEIILDAAEADRYGAAVSALHKHVHATGAIPRYNTRI